MHYNEKKTAEKEIVDLHKQFVDVNLYKSNL